MVRRFEIESYLIFLRWAMFIRPSEARLTENNTGTVVASVSRSTPADFGETRVVEGSADVPERYALSHGKSQKKRDLSRLIAEARCKYNNMLSKDCSL